MRRHSDSIRIDCVGDLMLRLSLIECTYLVRLEHKAFFPRSIQRELDEIFAIVCNNLDIQTDKNNRKNR
jgi:hypothetical protein